MRHIACFLTVGALGCGGLRVGSVSDVEPAALEKSLLVAPAAWEIAPSADAVVHSYGPMAGTSFGDEGWLLAGTAAGRAVHWYTYLAFDLSSIPEGTTVSAATLRLPLEPSTTPGAPPVLDVHVVVEPWTEADVAWHRQPAVSQAVEDRVWIADATAAPLDSPHAGPVDHADLARAVNDAIAGGAASVAFVVVPARPAESGVRRWASREYANESTRSFLSMPSLRLVAGSPPPPRNAAERDLHRGRRTDISSR